jgi:hypothetical protein
VIARPASYRILVFGLVGLTEHSSVESERKKKGGKKTTKGLVVESLLQKEKRREGNEAEGSGPYIITKPRLGGEDSPNSANWLE